MAGYQGVSRAREVTTLGRGGSDTTAVALAAALSAEACEIYSDVDGVWSADPRLVEDAQKLDELGYGEMQELARSGAKVLNAQAVEWARKSGIVIHALHVAGAGSGTRVVAEVERPAGKATGVALLADMVRLEAPGALLSELLALLGEHGAAPHEVLVGGACASIWLSLENIHGFANLRGELSKRFGERVAVDEGLAVVSAVGQGLCDTGTPLRTALAEVAVLGGPVLGVTAQGARLALLTQAAHGKPLLRSLHAKLVPAV